MKIARIPLQKILADFGLICILRKIILLSCWTGLDSQVLRYLLCHRPNVTTLPVLSANHHIAISLLALAIVLRASPVASFDQRAARSIHPD